MTEDDRVTEPNKPLPRCADDTLRRYLDELDESWKRPRYVLEPDPEREKPPQIQARLMRLRP
jgi:hypothetical protein